MISNLKNSIRVVPNFEIPNLINSKFRDNLDDSSWDDLSCVTLYYAQLYTQVYAQIRPIITMSHGISILSSLSLSFHLSPSCFDIIWQHCKITRFEYIIVEYIHAWNIDRNWTWWRESRNRRQKSECIVRARRGTMKILINEAF